METVPHKNIPEFFHKIKTEKEGKIIVFCVAIEDRIPFSVSFLLNSDPF